MPLNQELIYHAVDELRSISSMGLYYATNEYDKERYQKVVSIALGLLAALEERPFEAVQREFAEDNWLHMSPAVGAEALLVRDGKFMLIRRSDNGLWAVPGGLVEVGETLVEAAERELWEETGLRAQVSRLLGIFDSRLCHSQTKAQLYHVIFLADAAGGMPTPSIEATEIGFFGEQELPELSYGHKQRIPLLFKMLRGEIPAPYFDMPDRK
jgi:ADP-ribose pyrophosphatase YjhB (NUDIX family)